MTALINAITADKTEEAIRIIESMDMRSRCFRLTFYYTNFKTSILEARRHPE